LKKYNRILVFNTPVVIFNITIKNEHIMNNKRGTYSVATIRTKFHLKKYITDIDKEKHPVYF